MTGACLPGIKVNTDVADRKLKRIKYCLKPKYV